MFVSSEIFFKCEINPKLAFEDLDEGRERPEKRITHIVKQLIKERKLDRASMKMQDYTD